MLLERQTVDPSRGACRAWTAFQSGERRRVWQPPEPSSGGCIGLPVPQEGLATSPDEAAQLAAKMGFPVVLKIVSPDICTRPRAGRRAGRRRRRAGRTGGLRHDRRQRQEYNPPRRSAAVAGCSRCCRRRSEVIVGAVTDQKLRQPVAFGLGGVLVGSSRDVTFRLAPADAATIRSDARRDPSRRDAQGRARR